MRSSKLSAEEILKAEKAKDDRKRSRGRGFSKMRERDSGHALLSNGAWISWNIPGEWSDEVNGISTFTGNNVPPGMFLLQIGNEKKLFDAEEFRKWLRWA